MRSIVVGLAVLAGIATIIAVYFFRGAYGIDHGTVVAGDASMSALMFAEQTSLQLGSAAAIAAVILVAASCIVHAIGVVGLFRPRV